ncbi:putative translation initiation factor eIF-2B subunit delta [Diplogelasinospora grovesii]|uniref:Translation initiation factor eIF2B subunit delta n=1 Tax=Diplogelasinospora grovesii TaxID=303347 RepID=A0AAN6NGG9_9PEZI|nr:putative translation initiation factor eIF-2B subunit delta [Diplogelasinospora grovesii]
MATADSAPPQGQQGSDTPTPQTNAPATAPTNPPAQSQPQLTPAQLKAKAKAEKAARRAQVKEARAAAPPAPAAPSGADAKGAKGKGKQDGQQSQSKSGHAHRPSMAGRRPSLFKVEVDVRSTIPDCFSHISMAKRIQTSQADKDVHPAVLAVGQQMATFAIRDSIARLEATLLAFRKVIESYDTPKGNSLSRHFVPHVLNPQIEYLIECRPICFSMGNAIRLLKAKVNKFDIDTPEEEAKEGLLETIDLFIKERIELAEYMIARNAAERINQGDVILTYGRHRLVEKSFLRAKENGKDFAVCIIDDPFDRAGQDLAKALRRAGIPVFYSPNVGGLRHQVARSTSVLLGAEAMFANGSLQAPAGTADVAMAAADAGKNVTAVCETINFDRERVSVDALTYNEIDPERNGPESFRLMYDTTRPKYITGVITEYESGAGNSPTQAILTILRKQEDPTIA